MSSHHYDADTDPSADEQTSWSAAQLDAAQLELAAAVDQLLQPEIVELKREGYDPAHDDPEHDHDTADRTEITRLQLVIDGLIPRAQAAHQAGDRDRTSWLLDQIRRARGRQEGLRSAIHARGSRYGTLPPLLERLLDAVPASSDTGNAPSAGATRSIIGVAATDLVAHIDLTTRWGRTAGDPARADVVRRTPVALVGGRTGYDVRPARDLPRQLRRWAARAPWWRAAHPAYLIDAAPVATWWVEQARAVLQPSRPLTRPGACPACGTRTVLVDDDTGERVQRYALLVEPASGVTRCLACRASWPLAQWQHLARVLEQDRLEHAAHRQADALLRARGIDATDTDIAVVATWLLTGHADTPASGEVDSSGARTA